MVGFVRDTEGLAVSGARVYLVPAGDIPSGALALTDVAAERASTLDEPLEDTIAERGGAYLQGLTDGSGFYRIPGVAAGRYFVVVVPGDARHLPGGSLCRASRSHTALVDRQTDLLVSTAPSAAAQYVGPTTCYRCHPNTHDQKTLHMLGIRKIGAPGPLQDGARYPKWDQPLEKFKPAPDATTLYFYDYDGTAKDWKVSETPPSGASVSFTADLYRQDGAYKVRLANRKGSGENSYQVDLSYGGGLYKQRYIANVDGSRYVLPIQYNTEGQPASAPYTRWTWQQYNAQNWYDETKQALILPGKAKAFDNNCAGCHFTGYRLTGDETAGYRAHGVPDPNGEMDFDGDGKLESMNITCETCHGPGSEHAERSRRGHAIVSPRLLTPEREVAICAQCHTRARGIGGSNTEAPMNAAGLMMRAGTSRRDFLSFHVSTLDDGQWDAKKGDGLHAKKHHQQASDFLRSKKYRNATELLTCTSCHDAHGESAEPHQLRGALDSSAKGNGLCLDCHTSSFPEGRTVGRRMQNHWASKGITSAVMILENTTMTCVDCHMPKTAKSGAGFKQNTIGGVTYYSGDISSHLFDVPLRAAIPMKDPEMMAIPYTASCGGACHNKVP